jgi:hypothetical protein
MKHAFFPFFLVFLLVHVGQASNLESKEMMEKELIQESGYDEGEEFVDESDETQKQLDQNSLGSDRQQGISGYKQPSSESFKPVQLMSVVDEEKSFSQSENIQEEPLSENLIETALEEKEKNNPDALKSPEDSSLISYEDQVIFDEISEMQQQDPSLSQDVVVGSNLVRETAQKEKEKQKVGQGKNINHGFDNELIVQEAEGEHLHDKKNEMDGVVESNNY